MDHSKHSFTSGSYADWMDIDPVASVLASRWAATPKNIQLAVIKQDHEAAQVLATTLDQQVRSAPPPPDQGTKVDKLA